MLGVSEGRHSDRALTAYWAQWKFAYCAPAMKERARGLGYALLVHGSLARDIDMVAVPWTHEAASPDVLIAALTRVCREHNRGVAYGHTDIGERTEDPDLFQRTPKPHGRIAVSIHLGGGAPEDDMTHGTYIDLSVQPLLPQMGLARPAP